MRWLALLLTALAACLNGCMVISYRCGKPATGKVADEPAVSDDAEAPRSQPQD